MPRLAFRLSNPGDGAGQPVLLSRVDNTAGLDLSLAVDGRLDAAERLPSFSVALAPQGAEGAGVERVRHEGHPLLAALDPAGNRVKTQDASGLIQLESAGDLAEVRWVGDANSTLRLTRSVPLWGQGRLELVGVEAGALVLAPGDATTVQSWLLHDGGGDWPEVAGVVFLPSSLKVEPASGTNLAIAVVGVLARPASRE